MVISYQPAQIMALIRNGRMVNIGGRPVIVPNAKPQRRADAESLPAESRLADSRLVETKPDRNRGEAIKLALAFAAIYLVWGSTYLAIRYAVETIPPLVAAGIRHTTAGGFLLAWAYVRGFRPTRQHWLSGLVLGFFFFLVGHGTLHWAEQFVGSGLAALLIATEPLFIFVLGLAAGQQKVSRLSLLGLSLGVIGVALLTGIEASIKGSSLLGLLAVLGGSLAWSVGVVISPKLNLPQDALGRTAVPLICGAAMLLAASVLTGEMQATHWAAISLKSVLGLAYLIVFGSVVAFTAYTWLLQHCPPALVATHTYANPVVAVLLGWLLASEHLSLRVVLASLAILGAIVLIRKGERSAVAVAKPTEPGMQPELQPAVNARKNARSLDCA